MGRVPGVPLHTVPGRPQPRSSTEGLCQAQGSKGRASAVARRSHRTADGSLSGTDQPLGLTLPTQAPQSTSSQSLPTC